GPDHEQQTHPHRLHRHRTESPLINHPTRLSNPLCSLYVRIFQREMVMRLIMRGLTDVDFEQRFGTEAACLAALIEARRTEGMPCPRCDNPKSYIYGRRVGCTRCGRRWTVTAGTVMASTKLDLTVWFRAMHLMTSTKQGISAVELGRRLGVSYPTGWYLHKRLCRAMPERGERYQLGGPPADGGEPAIVEADDVYLGGERNKGQGTGGKTRVIAACERRADGGMGHVAISRPGMSRPSVMHASLRAPMFAPMVCVRSGRSPIPRRNGPMR